MPDNDNTLENYVEPDAVIEYIFIERAEEQNKPINDDQGYIMGFFNIFFSGTFKNNYLAEFKNQILNELNYSLKTYDHFKSKAIDMTLYKFGLVDNERNITEFTEMSESFFKELIASLRNLMIVGNNFDIENFKRHHIFNQWFDTYTNKI
ncbi:MAG: hypothetical protein EAX91_04720 [Candidatus Lokiarchaeota archaeon]|nr:hypothetical protein [Candidatus Lokiarchaeota archaeon]